MKAKTAGKFDDMPLGERLSRFVVIEANDDQPLPAVSEIPIVQVRSGGPAVRTIGSRPPAQQHHASAQSFQSERAALDPFGSFPSARRLPHELPTLGCGSKRYDEGQG